jgi:hypothetical protein
MAVKQVGPLLSPHTHARPHTHTPDQDTERDPTENEKQTGESPQESTGRRPAGCAETTRAGDEARSTGLEQGVEAVEAVEVAVVRLLCGFDGTAAGRQQRGEHRESGVGPG